MGFMDAAGSAAVRTRIVRIGAPPAGPRVYREHWTTKICRGVMTLLLAAYLVSQSKLVLWHLVAW